MKQRDLEDQINSLLKRIDDLQNNRYVESDVLDYDKFINDQVPDIEIFGRQYSAAEILVACDFQSYNDNLKIFQKKRLEEYGNYLNSLQEDYVKLTGKKYEPTEDF